MKKNKKRGNNSAGNRGSKPPPTGPTGPTGSDGSGWFGMAAFARAVKNPYVTGICVVVVAAFAAAAWASEWVVVVLGLAAIGSILLIMFASQRAAERPLEVRVDQKRMDRLAKNRQISIEVEKPKDGAPTKRKTPTLAPPRDQ